MSRKHGRTDVNQTDIVAAFRKFGATVKATADMGEGFPDLIVGFRGLNYLMEVKDGSKPPSGRKLTPDQEEFFRDWGGQVMVIKSVDEVALFMKAIIEPHILCRARDFSSAGC